MAVTTVPRSVSEVGLDRGDHPRDDRRIQPGEAGGRIARLLVEDALGMGPERAEAPVGRIAPHRDARDPSAPAEPLGEELDPREGAAIELRHLG